MRIIRCGKRAKYTEQVIKKYLYFHEKIKTCREIISPHVFIAIISVCNVQVFPDIRYRLIYPAVSAVVFQEWGCRIHDSEIMMALALV